MEEWLIFLTKMSVVLIDAMALVIIVAGTIEVFVAALRFMLNPSATNHEKRVIWLRYAGWLVAGLTFQLAADVIETAIAPSWDDIGKLGAIAVIRTFLQFLSRTRHWGAPRTRPQLRRRGAGRAVRGRPVRA